MSSTAICSTEHGFLPSPAPPTCRRGRSRPQFSLPPLQTWTEPRRLDLNGAALPRSGLHTPPEDDMGTTYQASNVMPHENSHHASTPGYAEALAQADRKRTALSDAQAALTNNYTRVPPSQAQPHHPPLLQTHTRHVVPSSIPTLASQPTSRHSTRPSTPTSNHSQLDDGISRRDSAMVMHSLDIPVCISPKGGSLSDFAAQLTCFFWFESIQVQHTAEQVGLIPAIKRIPRLQTFANPQPNFKKWVLNILSTTQVTQNVILLALLFIHRLKVTTLGVKGKPGSEYRLLTVALMLGNKFLDDNTYTNKTWAEVSGITVKEIHIMEVEFLSNMRYNLLVSKPEWESWLVKLSKFWEYCERATMPPASPLIIPSPTHRNFASPLPSPTGPTHLPVNLQPTTPSSTAYSPSTMYVPHGQAWPGPYQETIVSPLAHRPDLKNIHGKRYVSEDDPTEPPPKRASRQAPLSLPHQPLNHGQTAPEQVPAPLRLPAPHLTLNTAPHTQPPMTVASFAASAAYAPQTPSSNLSLPPLVPGVRAMATVFPPSTSSFAPQLPLLATSGPSIPSSGTMSSATMTAASTPNGYVPVGFGTPTKRMSPGSTLTPAAAYASSSPMAENFPPHLSGVHTPISHSPSIYLQQRSSPYKPIRGVNTLLYPPPSASLQEYHLSSTVVPPNQMHYQPLGRRNVYRSGIVPEFAAVPYGGAVERGLPLTPVHGVQVPTTRSMGQLLQAPYHN